MDKYLAAIKKNICSICADSNSRGVCLLNTHESCALELFLPRVVELIHLNPYKRLEDQVLLLREKVCTECRAGEKDNNCYLREDTNCSLDRYFPIIVESVMLIDKKGFA